MADINADPAVGAFTMGHMAQLAQETDAAVVLVHHLAKSKANVATPEEARALIRALRPSWTTPGRPMCSGTWRKRRAGLPAPRWAWTGRATVS